MVVLKLKTDNFLQQTNKQSHYINPARAALGIKQLPGLIQNTGV